MTDIFSAGTKVHYRWDLSHAWIQMLLRMEPLLRLGPNINIWDIYHAPFITLVPSTKCYCNFSKI